MSDLHLGDRRRGPRVIAAFPATGKSWLAEEFGRLVVDSDSSSFSWSEPGVRHPDWPGNYMRHIEHLAAEKPLRPVFVSTHAEVRSALAQHGIPFTLVYPDPSLREEYRDRMIRRGSPPALVVKVIDVLWDDALAECKLQDGCTHLVLGPGQYLSDVLNATTPVCFTIQLQHDCAWRCWSADEINSEVATAEGATPEEALANCRAKVVADA